MINIARANEFFSVEMLSYLLMTKGPVVASLAMEHLSCDGRTWVCQVTSEYARMALIEV